MKKTKNLQLLIILIAIHGLNTAWGQFVEQTGIILPGVYSGDCRWVDYDSDGSLDIMITGTTGSQDTTVIFRNNGNNTFSKQSLDLLNMSYSNIEIIDYNNDSHMDLLLSGRFNSNYKTILYKSLGGTNFQPLSSSNLPNVGNGDNAIGDFNKDGQIDICLTGFDGSQNISKLYKNNGNESFSENISSLETIIQSSVTFYDYNHDGYPDLLMSGRSSGPVSNLYDNITSTFNLSYHDLPGTASGRSIFGDYNCDGNPDILISGLDETTSQKTEIYKNHEGSFSKTINLVGLESSDGAWGDYDNDGDLDLLLSGNTGTSYISKIFTNNGDDTFTENSGISLEGTWLSSVDWGDYDNDGDLDILLIGRNNSNQAIAKVYKNTTTTVNTPPSAPSGLTSSVNNKDVGLSWNPTTDDHTPSPGLTYNIYMGTEPGKADIVSPMSNLSTGRRYVPKVGNAYHVYQDDTIKNLYFGQYYWSVQAIDNCFLGSPFAPEATFTIRPDASFTLPAKYCPHAPVAITYTGDANDTAQFSWNWDGGILVSGSGTGPYQVKWDTPGTKTITLTVTEAGISSIMHQEDITILDVNISGQPHASVTVCEGMDTTLSITANGHNLSYQWEAKTPGGDFAPLTNTIIYSGTQNNKMEISAIPLSLDNHAYRCIVTDDCGNTDTSITSTLSVNSVGITITREPSDTSACEGTDAFFNLLAEGAELSYYWQVNSITGFSNLVNSGAYQNVNTNNLSIPGAAALLNNTEYRCIITGSCASPDTSVTVTLSVMDNPEPVITTNETLYACTGDTIQVEVTGTFASYTWSTGDTTRQIDVTEPGSFTVSVTDENNCHNISNPLEITEDIIPAQEICLVTIDEKTGKNMVVWDRRKSLSIEKYMIYRQGNEVNVYNPIGEVFFDSTSIFVDSAFNNERRVGFYKILAIDTCGNETAFSKYHKTIQLMYDGFTSGVNLLWKAYLIDGDSVGFKSYIIYRGIDSLFLEPIDTLAGNEDSYIDDSQIAKTKTVYYRIAGIKKDECYPGNLYKSNNGPFSRSLSNLEDNRQKETTVSNQFLHVFIYPNPFNEKAFIRINEPIGNQGVIRVFDLSGNVVFEDQIEGVYYELDRGKLLPGMYVLEISGKKIYRGKFIVE